MIARFLRISSLASFLAETRTFPPLDLLSERHLHILSLSLSLALSFIQSHTLALAVSTNGRSLWDDAQLGKSMAIAFASEHVSNDLKLIELTYPPSCQYHVSLLLIRESIHRFFPLFRTTHFIERRPLADCGTFGRALSLKEIPAGV